MVFNNMNGQQMIMQVSTRQSPAADKSPNGQISSQQCNPLQLSEFLSNLTLEQA